MQVIVSEVQYDGGTIAIGIGTNVETDKPVRFGGDWRPMSHLAEVIEAEGPVEVEVESWQVLGAH